MYEQNHEKTLSSLPLTGGVCVCLLAAGHPLPQGLCGPRRPGPVGGVTRGPLQRRCPKIMGGLTGLSAPWWAGQAPPVVATAGLQPPRAGVGVRGDMEWLRGGYSPELCLQG